MLSNKYNFNKVFFLLITITCFSHHTFSQGETIDSLKSKLVLAQSTEKIDLLHQLTRELWYYEPDEAMKYAEMAYQLSFSLNDSSNMAMALKNKGIVLYFTGENKNAINCYNKALKIYTKLNEKKGISSCVNNLGIIYMDLGNYKKALLFYQKSIQTDIELNDEQALASSLSNAGIVYHLQGMYDMAIAYYQKSLALEIKFKNYDGIGECLMNIGVAYQDNGMSPESKNYYDKALIIFKKTGNKNRFAMTCYNIAKMLYTQKDYFKSYLYIRHSLKIRYEIDDLQGIASGLNLLALIYEATGNDEKANEYLFKSLLMELELGNKRRASIVLSNKGMMLLKNEEYEEALNFFLNSMEIAKDINARPELLDNYQNLSKVYYLIDDSTRGLYYDDMYWILADSIQKDAKHFSKGSLFVKDSNEKVKTSRVNHDLNGTETDKKMYYFIFSAAFVIFIIVFIFLRSKKST